MVIKDQFGPPSVADYNPNMRKNRIPTGSELSGLKEMANTLTKSVLDMKEDIKRAQDAHKLLLAKYQQQFRELEGTQSQLHELKELIEFLQKQCRNFKSKSNRLSGIIHPIRRYPTDVLQIIFELACQASNPANRIHTAIRLSHVCQRWRMISVDTPRLWCDVTFSFGMKRAHTSAFWSSLIPRMRCVPASITLLSLDEAGGNRLKQCNLRQISVISSLMLDLTGWEYFSRIKSFPCFWPRSGVKQLTVQHIPRDDRPDGVLPGTWDIGDLLENVPPVTELDLNAPCQLIITPSTKLATITRLRLKGMVNVDVLSTVSLLPTLSHLDLQNAGFTPVVQTTQVVSNSLKYLKVCNSEAELWLERLSCPNLDTFLVGDVLILELYTSFIKEHPSITHLDMCGELENIATLASVASQAQTLVVDSDLSLLYKRKIPRVRGAPFPTLTRLIVDTLDVALTHEDFEGVVRARCLPHGHRLSKRTASLKPLTALSIRRDPTATVEEAWRDSELFHSARKTNEEDPDWTTWEILTLSWV
jgi:hypothetical protein